MGFQLAPTRLYEERGGTLLYRLGVVGAANVHAYRIAGKTLAKRLHALHNLVNGTEYLLVHGIIECAELLIAAHVAPSAAQPCLKIEVRLLQGSDELLVYSGFENNLLKRLGYPEVAPTGTVVDKKIKSPSLTKVEKRTVYGSEYIAERGIQRPVTEPYHLHLSPDGTAQIVCRHHSTHPVGKSAGRYQHQTGLVHNIIMYWQR